MKKYRVPIFTEEYFVNVYIGTKAELIKAAAAYASQSDYSQAAWWFEDNFKGRGHMFHFSDMHPLILVDGDLPAHVAIATLAHEASHAVNAIMDFIVMNDTSGEFLGHGIGAIMRAVVKDLIPKEPKNGKSTR